MANEYAQKIMDLLLRIEALLQDIKTNTTP